MPLAVEHVLVKAKDTFCVNWGLGLMPKGPSKGGQGQLPSLPQLLVALVRRGTKMLSRLRLLPAQEALIALDPEDIVTLVGSVLQGDIRLVV